MYLLQHADYDMLRGDSAAVAAAAAALGSSELRRNIACTPEVCTAAFDLRCLSPAHGSWTVLAVLRL